MRLVAALQITCVAIVVAAFSPLALSQSPNWWTLNIERDLAEKGKLKELLTKKKVYVNVSFSDTQTEFTAQQPGSDQRQSGCK